MKKILVMFSCLLVLLITTIVKSNAFEDMETIEESSMEDSIDSDEETSSINFDFIDFVAEDLLSLQEDILSESKEIKNRSLRSVASKVGRVVKYINRAKSNAEDADPSSCSDDLENALTAIEATLDKLESKSCAESPSKRCIPEDLVEDFSLDLEDLFDDLDEEVFIDDNEDDIPDACGS